MIKGKTTSGFEFEIDEEVLNDWELVEDLQEMDEGKFFRMVKITKKLLGIKGYKELKKHVKNMTGGLKLEDVEREVMEIMNYNDETKNS